MLDYRNDVEHTIQWGLIHGEFSRKCERLWLGGTQPDLSYILQSTASILNLVQERISLRTRQSGSRSPM